MDEFSSTIEVHDDSRGERHDHSLEFDEQNIPDELPILPLRGVVVYPHPAPPLTIGQARSISLVDDVVGPQLDIGEKDFRTIAIPLPVFGDGSEVAIGGEVVRDAERLHIGLMQLSAILIPQFAAVGCAELVVLLRSGRVEVEIPFSPL